MASAIGKPTLDNDDDANENNHDSDKTCFIGVSTLKNTVVLVCTIIVTLREHSVS